MTNGLIDMRELSRANNRYKFKIKQVGCSTCLIDTGEEWLIEVISPTQLILRHKNTRHNTDRYHVQGYFGNYYKLLKYIDNHKNKWNNVCNGAKRLEQIFAQINNQSSIICETKT
jgi:hypothetical protein